MDLRAEFPVFERTAYLNAGSDGPLPQAAVDAARESLETALRDGRRIAHFEGAARPATRCGRSTPSGWAPGSRTSR